VRISQAALLIYTNPEMEPWVEKVLAMDAAKKVLPVNSSLGISMFGHDEEEEEEDDPNKHEHGEESHHHGHGEHGLDPHVWTDPLNAKVMVDNISRALQKVDPENAAYYSGNAENLKKELDKLHQEYQAALRPYRNRTIIYAGHFAFGYLAKRYGLEHLSPYEGFSPNAEPTPQKIIQLSEHLRKTGMKTIFIEELLDPKVGRIISKQTGAKMVLLHGIHNVTKEEMKEGVSYVSLMRKNLLNLKEAFHSAE
jgi:zinc transport system substrate-binding protein